MIDDPIGASGGLGQYLEGLDVSPPEMILDLADGDVVKGAGLRFDVLHTPGHTKGSVCFLLETEDGTVLFSGDHLFAGSVGRTDLPGGSWEELMESMRAKILPLSDSIAVCPGHGPSTTIGKERSSNPFVLEAIAGG
jgi:glyoxylase-like metal-dependent hydrolase (beta-lactamase superfamily II)